MEPRVIQKEMARIKPDKEASWHYKLVRWGYIPNAVRECRFRVCNVKAKKHTHIATQHREEPHG